MVREVLVRGRVERAVTVGSAEPTAGPADSPAAVGYPGRVWLVLAGLAAAGAMLQLDINTRIGLTARAGFTKAHEASGANIDRMTDLIFGLSVY